jgi:predicted NAD/FAD-binding protein
MIFDIIRFNQFALDLLKEEPKSEEYSMANGNGAHHAEEQETIGQYLEREGYSDAFRDDYLIPMTAAVWSTSPDKCSLECPAVTLVRFM